MYLRENGLHELAEKISVAKSRNELVEIISKHQESEEGQKGKDLLDDIIKIIKINPNQEVSKYFDEILSDIQTGLVTGSRSKNTSVEVTLDGNIDEEKDKNPGEIVRDCTVGKTNLFLSPKSNMFNVKFYTRNAGSEQKEHKGNIYLLEFKTSEGDGWYIDAFQIAANINWEESVNGLVETLIEQARAKNVKMILINCQIKFTSERGSLAHAIINNLKQRGLEPETNNYGSSLREAYWGPADKEDIDTVEEFAIDSEGYYQLQYQDEIYVLRT